jgi:hypothetical protein
LLEDQAKRITDDFNRITEVEDRRERQELRVKKNLKYEQDQKLEAAKKFNER